MKQLLKAAYELLKQGSDYEMKHIVFTETNMIIISSSVILFYDYEKQCIPNSEYLYGKYLSFEDLSDLIKIKCSFIIPQKTGFLIDYQDTVKYSGTYVTTSTRKDNQFAISVSSKGIYQYETDDKIVNIPVGYVLYILSVYLSKKSCIGCSTWGFNYKIFSSLAKAITLKQHNKSLNMDFFSVKKSKSNFDIIMYLSENIDDYLNTNTFAFVSQQIDKRKTQKT